VRRLINGTIAYLRTLWTAAAEGWRSFFFTPADPTPLGLIRILVGALLFWSIFVTGLDLHANLGSHSWADAASVRDLLQERDSWAWSFWFWVPDSALRAVWVLCLVILAAFTIGIGSRVTAVLAWVIAVSTIRRAPVILFGFDNIVTTWSLYLAVCGTSGQALSLDHFVSRYRQARAEATRRRKDGRWLLPAGAPEPTVSANLTVRLIQLHLVLIYGMAGLAKLQGVGWWNGFASWGVVAAGEFRRFDLTWLAEYPSLLNVMTHTGLAFELLFPILIWNRLLRPLFLFTAVLLHIGIDLTLGLTEFGIAMLAGNLAFVSGPWLRSLITGRTQPYGRVLYDGACPRCRASMALVTAADPDHVVAPIDLSTVDVTSIHPTLTNEACLRAMHLVDLNGRIDVGFDALVRLARWLPLGWPFGILGSLPGVALIGRRAYNAFAARRARDVPCTDETCAIHPPAGKPAPDDKKVASGASSRSIPR
jgi:predicted DCC family thiol-disulfide oxidoreductase YuxK